VASIDFREVAFFLMKKAQRGSYVGYSNPVSARR